MPSDPPPSSTRSMADFVERRTTKGLETTLCAGAVVVPPFN
jgi:hypothetical protein